MFVLRQETRDRLTTEYENRVEDILHIIDIDLSARKQNITRSLTEIGNQIADDNRFRTSLISRNTNDRRYLIDYAGSALALSNLSTLYLVSDDDVILSSGHFRNEYDRIDPGLVSALGQTPGSFAFTEIRFPDTLVVALSSLHTINLGGESISLIGGTTIDDQLVESMQRTPEVSVTMYMPGLPVPPDTDSTAETVSSRISFPYIPIDRTNRDDAAIVVAHDTSGLSRLHDRLDRWFLAVGLASILGAFLLAWFLASRISKPIHDVSARARRLDLDHLNVNFHSSRKDEIGDLSRTLSTMTSRLRRSRSKVIDMERKAAIGDIARQVNHDIRNGLTPIRNIVRYLDETAANESDLRDAFMNRKSTLDSSINYLYDLASNYARLSHPGQEEPVDLPALLKTLVDDARAAGHVKIDFESRLPGGQNLVVGSPLSLRRIFENLLDNAIDSVQETNGSVTVVLESCATDGSTTVCVKIIDEGPGIPADLQDTIFDDFYTTKPSGTGLGLSIVRRLVMDLNGTISVASKPGNGSTFTVELPLTFS